MLKNNLISLLDTAFPDANRLFSSPPRADGSEKWVDFVATFWHCECVCGSSEKVFVAKYQKWCKKLGYNFSEDKALDIYASACGHFGVMPKTDTAKLLVEQAVSLLRVTSTALASLKQEMQSLAASLPEYPVVMKMFGVGPALGPQLMAEIGDVRRFHSKKALVAVAGFVAVVVEVIHSTEDAGSAFTDFFAVEKILSNTIHAVEFKIHIAGKLTVS